MTIASAHRMLEAALAYAARGWPVFPIHTIENGRCTCGGKPGCKPGKHPRSTHGFKDATTDPKIIRRWWTKWHDANIGIPTGKVVGWVVWDIDPRNEGDETLAALIEQHGPLPHTVEAITGGGGRHILVAHPGFHVHCRNGLLPGIDMKGDGGYIVVEPSLHESGNRYAWEWSHLPDDTPIAPMPAWMVVLLRAVPGQQFSAGRNGETERTEMTENTEMSEPCQSAADHGSISLYSSINSVISADSVLSVFSVSPEAAQQIAEAIESTAPNGLGQRNRGIFTFARVLKGVSAIADAAAAPLRPLVNLWHKRAFPVIGTKPFEDTWIDFVHAWPRVHFLKGENPMARIFARSEAAPAPSCAPNYESPDTIRLIKLCRELQRATGDAPFFLTCRTAGELLGIDHNVAWKRLRVLEADGIIRVEEKGKTGRATRYRYLEPDVEIDR